MTASGAASFGSRTAMSCASRRWRRGGRCGRVSASGRHGSASPGCGPDSRARCRPTNSTSSSRLSRRSMRGSRTDPASTNFWRISSWSSSTKRIGPSLPTFTSVMQDVGLTRFQRADEPFLPGLTATPYRGRDEEETDRLVPPLRRQAARFRGVHERRPPGRHPRVAGQGRARPSRPRDHRGRNVPSRYVLARGVAPGGDLALAPPERREQNRQELHENQTHHRSV